MQQFFMGWLTSDRTEFILMMISGYTGNIFSLFPSQDFVYFSRKKGQHSFSTVRAKNFRPDFSPVSTTPDPIKYGGFA
jgi:hypothetical protein